MTGTPKTLTQALINALTEIGNLGIELQSEQVRVLRAHVKDWASQKFGMFFIQEDSSVIAQIIWAKLFESKDDVVHINDTEHMRKRFNTTER